MVIVGPTASGKTALSLEIARRFNGEIISADSRQIYRGMDVGTAKPTPQKHRMVSPDFHQIRMIWLKNRGSSILLKQNREKHRKNKKLINEDGTFHSDDIRHYLIDIKNPNQDYSVGQYKKDALVAIKQILKAGKLPIIVGGTGLYVDAVVKNLDIPEVKENKKLRAKLEKEIKIKGLGFVFKKLVELDPEAAYIVDPKNPRRIIRAMEVALSTGKPFSAQRKIGLPLFNFLQIGLKLPQDELKEKIQKRTAQMIKTGLIDEVKKLVKKYGYKPKALDAIGYREIIDYLKTTEMQKKTEDRNLDQGISLKKAEVLINKNTWHYARRQMNWFTQHHFCPKSGAGFKRNPIILWFDPNQKSASKKIIKAVSKFLKS